jgi:hypothetical protein
MENNNMTTEETSLIHEINCAAKKFDNPAMPSTETNRRDFEEWFYHVKNDSTLHCEKVIAWEAWQAARERQDKGDDCIQCDNSGRLMPDGDQCEWCYREPNSKFNKANPPTSEKI